MANGPNTHRSSGHQDLDVWVAVKAAMACLQEPGKHKSLPVLTVVQWHIVRLLLHYEFTRCSHVRGGSASLQLHRQLGQHLRCCCSPRSIPRMPLEDLLEPHSQRSIPRAASSSQQ